MSDAGAAFFPDKAISAVTRAFNAPIARKRVPQIRDRPTA
jgi:hypothetical protein